MASDTSILKALAAATRSEFRIVYQPRFRFHGLSLVRVEALLRWDSPILGRIQPSQFIPLAEQSGDIDWLTEHVISTVNWQFRHQCIPVSINLSIGTLMESVRFEKLERTLSDMLLPATQIEFEITESLPCNSIDTLSRRLKSLAADGFEVALDDVGSGFATLNRICSLPARTIKLDRELFVLAQNPDYAERAGALITSMSSMAHSSGLTLVIEGVENKEDVDLLGAVVGSPEVQGFWYSRPYAFHNLVQKLEAIDRFPYTFAETP